MSPVVKKRESNIELFRIIMMLLIVAHHYVVNSGIEDVMSANPNTWQSAFLYILGMWGKIGINCFVLITGYFMCKSDITVRKFLKLLLEVLFYNIVIYLIFAICEYEPFTFAGLAKAINPISSIAKGFTSCFLIYYLLIPFLNVFVKNLSREMHRKLILWIFLFFVLWDHIPGVEFQFNYVGWFCIMHIIASYIRFYEQDILKRIHNRTGLLALGMVSLAILSVLFQIYGGAAGIAKGWACKWVIDCNALLAVPTSVALFMCLKNINLPHSKWINSIASSTFAVLLIHAHSDTMRRLLWHDVCRVPDWYTSPYLPVHAFSSVLLIFFLCVMIDKLRIWTIEKPIFKLIDSEGDVKRIIDCIKQ